MAMARSCYENQECMYKLVTNECAQNISVETGHNKDVSNYIEWSVGM